MKNRQNQSDVYNCDSNIVNANPAIASVDFKFKVEKIYPTQKLYCEMYSVIGTKSAKFKLMIIIPIDVCKEIAS